MNAVLDAMGRPATTPRFATRFAQATHRGMVREENEDAIAVENDAGFALVADGMGGYNAGEVASGLAARYLSTHLALDLPRLYAQPLGRADQRQLLQAVLRARTEGANVAIIDEAGRHAEMAGMGTTLALLLLSDDEATTLHLGDSRIYRFRDDVLSLLTRDHSLLQEQLDAGAITPGEARLSLHRNFVTRALGVDAVTDPEIHHFELAPGDLYLICSDGLPDMLTDEDIFMVLRDGGLADGDGRVAAQDALDALAARFIDEANGQGGRDNVSVVLASVGWSHEGNEQANERADADANRHGSDDAR